MIPFEEESAAIKEKVVGYWTKRSESFSDIRHKEVHSYKRELWLKEISENLPAEAGLKILDVGCGTGFFEIVLEPMGYEMTGIDLTPDMITEGNELLAHHYHLVEEPHVHPGSAFTAHDHASHDVYTAPSKGSAKLMVMDAEELSFPDESFDAVITRNLTWTLPHPDKAYREWFRVLKPGGILLNFDAEYAKGFHKYDQSDNIAHKDLGDAMVEECHEIYHMLSISAFDRPAWDETILKEIGFREVMIDPSAGDRLYGQKDEFYAPDRMFRIKAIK